MKPIRVGLVADPAAPTAIARQVSDLDPPHGEDLGTWDVEVVSEPLTTGCEDVDTAVDRLRDQAGQREWDVVVGLTELPLGVQVLAGDCWILMPCNPLEHVQFDAGIRHPGTSARRRGAPRRSPRRVGPERNMRSVAFDLRSIRLPIRDCRVVQTTSTPQTR